MSNKDIQKVMKIIPQLTDFGIGIFGEGRGLTSAEKKEKFKKNRQTLLDSVESFKKQ